jgi:hypothetical protein
MRSRILAALLALTAAARADEEFKLESPDIGPDKEFSEEFAYDAFGCSGSNHSFALSWSGAPAGPRVSPSPRTIPMRWVARVSGIGS